MLSNTADYLANRFPRLAPAIKEAVRITAPLADNGIALMNQDRVLAAFRRQRVSAHDLNGTTGYGYNDTGREKLEHIYSQVMGTEAALVRPQIASGTHALWLALAGNIAPGQEILAVTGPPYATLQTVLASTGPGSLGQQGVTLKTVALAQDGELNWQAIAAQLSDRTGIVYVQRSRGYALRPALGCAAIKELAQRLAQRPTRPWLVVDNCYGEFVEAVEPGHCGADLVAGSLIKNPGGGLAHTGGYVAGKKELVANAADRLLAPGLEGQVGATGPYLHGMYQGLFLAPHFVGQAVFNARFAAALAEILGFQALPRWDQDRYDIVQAIIFGDSQLMLAFCQAIQAWSPVDSFVCPTPGPVPGYTTDVVMAAGTFVQGASLELSADGPMAPPYAVYLQGGLGSDHGLLAICAAFAAVLEQGRE